MRFRGPLRKNLLSSCADVGPEDGIDPRKDDLKRSDKAPNRKALQLCSQVERTLNLVLVDSGEECLRDLLVAAVDPAPDSTRLLVTLCPALSAEAGDPGQVMAALHRAQRLLRREVAAAIHRKKTPELTFRLIG
jgi:ribosome-binding factor A